ncbi:poly-gamma-glutamate synthesis protein (capsule biosynthesis protein) [Sphingomonas palmae]|uniref:Poly-gamma-glutamate synthesis protein (Capsule biosynthesis protein) n=1 Tax=Sphingomonas palmae TaxID=1855283 RepID=A0A1H7M5P0_9SPHN|nr:poly-gamma-glutamate synthesis protein (capsule biosynthesis protein) [Sphingomonas palmae]
MGSAVTELLIGMVGDLLIDRDQPDEPLAPALPLLNTPDIMFGNLEACFTDDPHPSPSGATPLYPGSHNLDAFVRAGFDVLSLANNHMVDAGHAAMLDNIARLRSQGVHTAGAGANLTAARETAFVTAKGLTTGFVARASVFPMGYEARSNVPGIAPLRAYDLWRPFLDNYYIPGVPPRAQTVPDDGDLSNLASDLSDARSRADLVVASYHWGDMLRPFHLSDHERRTAYWSIDNGADLVVGHHHHALRGIEWYHGKPIFYGLGHFVFDARLEVSEEAKAMIGTDPESFGIFPRDGWPLLPTHPDTRMTIFAYARADAEGVRDIGFVPCRLRPDGRIEPVQRDSAEGQEVIAYVERCNTSQGLNARLTTDDATDLAGWSTVRVVPR